MSLAPGTQVGRFRVTRLIAQGGMAEVYRAEQELAGGILRPTALKVIRPEYSESPDFREMFLDEARLACTLSHPNIVHIYEVGEDDGRLFMAMELVSGESLAVVSRALRERGERLSDEALIAIGIFTCSALEAVHALRLPGQGHVNLVHRDVSPHNLLLSSSGSLKLIDFGIAKATTNRNLTTAGMTKGKAGYFSPEQAMGRPLDGRSDLFSLGVTLYKLAWGGTPFDHYKTHLERNTALVNGRWQPLRAVCPGLPEGFYAIVDKALQVNPKDRFNNAAEMRMALEKLAFESGFHVGPSTLAGYVPPQADDPPALGNPGMPSPARPVRRASRQSPAPSTAAAATQLRSTRAAIAQEPRPTAVTASARGGAGPTGQAEASRSMQPTGISAPHHPRRTERLAERVRAPSASSLQLQRTRRRLFLISGSAVVVLATVVGLMIGTHAAREAERAEGAALPKPLPAPVEARAPKPPEPQPGPEPQLRPGPQLPAPADEAPPAARAAQATRPPAPTPAKAERRKEAKSAFRAEAVTRVAAREPEPKGDGPEQVVVAPKGNGSLRVGGNQDAQVEVNGKRSPPPPFNLTVPAGSYTVVVKSLDGKRQISRTVEVRPDHASKLVYDLDRNTITVSD